MMNQIKKHVTIQQVAKQAGVSIQTVSRVLNNRPDVSIETRQRIQAIIDQMGYQPFAIARGLASKRTYTLGLVAADFSDFWFSQVVTGAEKEAHEHGYYFMLGSSSANPEDEPKFLRLLTERHVEGVLFVRASSADESEHLIRLSRHDEIVFVQTLDLVRPPLHCDSSPLGNNQWVVILFLCDHADLIRERNGFNEVFEFKDTLQTLDAIHFFNLPVRNLWVKSANFRIGQSRFAATASDVFSRSRFVIAKHPTI